MKSKKVTMLAAALVVAVVAAAGIGYATTYTAKTTNTNNQLDSTFITVSQTGTAIYAEDFLTSIYFDTVNTATKDTSVQPAVYNQTTTYSPVAGYIHNGSAYTDTIGQSTPVYALVSENLSLQFVKTNVPDTEEVIQLDVEVTNFTPVSGLDYTLVLTDMTGATVHTITPVSSTAVCTIHGSEATGTTQTFTLTNIDISSVVNFNVYLFISLEDPQEPVTQANATNIAHAGFNIGSTTSSVVYSVFTFTATVNPPAPENP